MSKADAAAAILWVGATFYALFGGADFGGGVWDLVAGGPKRGERPRALIQRSLTPVWEANHVWLPSASRSKGCRGGGRWARPSRSPR